jgi:hypothetical protein
MTISWSRLGQSRPALIGTPSPWSRVSVPLVVLLLTACVGSPEDAKDRPLSREEQVPTDWDLLARASAVLRAAPERAAWDTALAYADLDTARDQLGLAETASLLGPGKRRLLLSFATRPLFRFSTVIPGRPSLGPLSRVLDDQRIDVAVGTNFAFSGPGGDQIWPWDALLLRTRQPFKEIARLLRREGYDDTAEGLLVADRRRPRVTPYTSYTYPSKVPFPAVGRAPGGIVVFGGSAQAVRAAQQGESRTDLVATAALMADLPGVARVAVGRTARGLSGRCVVAVGLGEDATPRVGQMVVIVNQQAEGRRFAFNGLTFAAISEGAEVVFGQATGVGNRVRVRFTSTDLHYPTRLGAEDVAVPYDCR